MPYWHRVVVLKVVDTHWIVAVELVDGCSRGRSPSDHQIEAWVIAVAVAAPIGVRVAEVAVAYQFKNSTDSFSYRWRSMSEPGVSQINSMWTRSSGMASTWYLAGADAKPISLKT